MCEWHVYVCTLCLCVCAIKITLFASCNFIELEEHTLPKVFTQLANLSRQEGEEERGGVRERSCSCAEDFSVVLR